MVCGPRPEFCTLHTVTNLASVASVRDSSRACLHQAVLARRLGRAPEKQQIAYCKQSPQRLRSGPKPIRRVVRLRRDEERTAMRERSVRRRTALNLRLEFVDAVIDVLVDQPRC